jgi:small subunit ribosomal protein S16
VAAESSYPRDGRFLEILGTYDPRNKQAGLNLNIDGLQGWISKGAEISTTVQKLMRHSQQSASSGS